MLTVTLRMELRRVCEENASLTEVANEYEVQMRNLEKMVNDE